MIYQLILIFVGLGMDQFVDDEAEGFRRSLTDLRTRIFRRQEFGQVDHPFQRRPGPFARDLAFSIEHIQFFLRVINESQ